MNLVCESKCASVVETASSSGKSCVDVCQGITCMTYDETASYAEALHVRQQPCTVQITPLPSTL